MSGSWDAMLADEDNLEHIRQDHALTEAAYETRRVGQIQGHYGTTSFRQGYRSGWWDAVAWTIHLQGRANDLTDMEWLTEIRKGRGSIYWPVFEPDPTFKADCRTCGRQRIFDSAGRCDVCGWEIS